MELPGARWRRNWPSDWDVWRVAETTSTNADLVAAARAGLPHHTVLIADHQTAGAGRLGRVWEAAPGANLLVSMLFRGPLETPHAFTQQVAVAAARAVSEVSGDHVELKWPNDLLLSGRKLAGILAQAGGSGGRVDFVVVGLGLNIGWAPPEGAHLTSGTPESVLASILGHLDELAAEPTTAFAEYRSRLGTLGRRVRVELPAGQFVGIADSVEPDGVLVVMTDDGPRRVETGDVVHMRDAAS